MYKMIHLIFFLTLVSLIRAEDPPAEAQVSAPAASTAPAPADDSADDSKITTVTATPKSLEVVPLDKKGVINVAFQDADVLTVMKGISQLGNYDFVTKGEINKTVNLTLKGRSIRESLDIISDSTQTEYKVDGSIVTVFGEGQDPAYTKTYTVLKGNTVLIADLLKDLIGATVVSQAQPGQAAPGGAPAPSGGSERAKVTKGNARLGVDKLNGQIIITAVPSDHRKVDTVWDNLDVDKPQKRYVSKMFELKFITPDVFQRSVKFLIPGIEDSQIFLFTGGAGGSAAAGGASGGGAGGGLSAAQKRIIIQETPANITRIEELLTKIDLPPRQVVIDVKMVQFSLNNGEKLGVDWKTIFTSAGRSLPVGEFFSPMSNSGTGRVKFGSLGPDHLQIIMDFIKTHNTAKVLSNPQVTALDGTSAKIKVGDKIPYRKLTNTNGVVQTEVVFESTGVELSVKPVIFKNDFVNLEIKPIISSRNGEFDGIPIISTKETDSSLNIRNNHTVIMGGLISTSEVNEIVGIPILSKIPGIGKLFRSDAVNKESSELIFLITPRIYSEFEGHHNNKLKYNFDDEKETASVPYRFVEKEKQDRDFEEFSKREKEL